MPTTRLRLIAALVSLTALAACQQQPMNDAQRDFILMGGFSRQTMPQPYYHQPYMIPANNFVQPRGFSCSAVGNTTYCN